MKPSQSVRSSDSLSTGLKSRHVTMLSLAGVIGAGLFIGSGHAIAAAGPAVLISYIMAGTLVVLIMRMLGEMAVASPDTGSFSTYAARAIGPWAGFTIGWLYWWFWVLVIPWEAVAVSTILQAWFPGANASILAIGFIALMTLSNLYSVAKYGEFEFWFALLKIIAIIAFIALCAIVLLGGWPGREVSGFIANVQSYGGFAPNGYGPVFGALLMTMFSFMGAEIVTIAAAESKNPAQQIARSTNSVIWRIGIFYIASVFLILAIVPWNDAALPIVGSYQRTLELLNIPHAKLIIDIVVVVAVASNLNSAIYTASRMLFALARRGDAPDALKGTTAAGVPVMAVLASVTVGFVATLVNYFAPGHVFKFLISTSGAVALLVYLVIAISQLRMRRQLIANGQALTFRMWLYPWLTCLVIGFIVCVLGYMFTMPEHVHEVTATSVLAILVIIAGVCLKRKPSSQLAAVSGKAG